LIIGHALDNQSASIGRKVKWLAAHGAGGVGRTRALPTINTPGMERVTTWQCTIRLVSHGSKTYRALRAFVDPAALFTTMDLASARGSVSRLGTTSTGLHYIMTRIKFQRDRRGQGLRPARAKVIWTFAPVGPRPRGSGSRPGTFHGCCPRRACGRPQ
jgi:hypothetical protein